LESSLFSVYISARVCVCVCVCVRARVCMHLSKCRFYVVLYMFLRITEITPRFVICRAVLQKSWTNLKHQVVFLLFVCVAVLYQLHATHSFLVTNECGTIFTAIYRHMAENTTGGAPPNKQLYPVCVLCHLTTSSKAKII
jgi:hypothetical protein